MKSLAVITVALTVALFSSPAAVARPDTTPAAAPSFDASVHSMAYTNRHFFIGGDFTSASHDGEQAARHHLAAVDAEGRLTDFAPEVDGPVTVMASDGQYLYISGDFTKVDGHKQPRLARVDQSTGALDTSFRPGIDGTVHELETYGKRLYVGGDLAGRHLIALNAADGTESTEFTPTVDRPVYALHATASRLYIGGEFTEVNGDPASHLAALRSSSGTRDTEFAPRPRHSVHDIIESGRKVFTAGGGRLDAYTLSGAQDWGHATDGEVTELSTHDGEIYAAGDFQQVCQASAATEKPTCEAGAHPRRYVFAASFTGTVTEWEIAPGAVVTSMASSPRQLAVGGEFAAFDGGQHTANGFALFT